MIREADVRKYLREWVDKHKKDPEYIDVSWEDLEENLPWNSDSRNPTAMKNLVVEMTGVVLGHQSFDEGVKEAMPYLRVQKGLSLSDPKANWRRGITGLMEDIGTDIGSKYYGSERRKLAEPINLKELAGKDGGPAYEKYLQEARQRSGSKNDFYINLNFENRPEVLNKIQQALGEAARTSGPPGKVQEYVSVLRQRLGTDYALVDDLGNPDKRIKEIQEKAYKYVFEPGQKVLQEELGRAEQDAYGDPGKHNYVPERVYDMRRNHEMEENRHKKWQDKYLRGFGDGGGNWSNPASWEAGWIED
jgi:hypothetical protein